MHKEKIQIKSIPYRFDKKEENVRKNEEKKHEKLKKC